MRRGGGFYNKTIGSFGSGFDKGIIDVFARGKAPIGSFLDCLNVRVDDGSIKGRDGQRNLDDDYGFLDAGNTINAIYQYKRQYNPPADQGQIATYRAYIFASGDYLYLWDGEGDPTIWRINDDLLNITLDSDDIYACTYLDYIYLMNGYQIIKTDGIAGAGHTENITDATGNSIGRFTDVTKPVVYKDRMYFIRAYDPSLLWYSNLGKPQEVENTSWIDVHRDDGDYIVICGIRGNTLYMFKENSIWSLTGDPEANPIVQVEVGGDNTPNQTHYGLGCTSPRSLVSVGDSLIFYSKHHGVYQISDSIKCISTNCKALLEQDNRVGGTYTDGNNNLYYILTGESGYAYVCNLKTGSWVKDSNINTKCFVVDHRGYLIGGKANYIVRFYHPDYTTDIDENHEVDKYIRFNWIDMMDGHLVGVPRRLVVAGKDRSGFLTGSMWNENDEQAYDNFALESGQNTIDLLGEPSRLCSLSFGWQSGEIEELVMEYQKTPLR